MANASLTGPGIFWANSGVTLAPSVFPYPAYVRWYEDVHIPDWTSAKPGLITAAWRYQRSDTDDYDAPGGDRSQPPFLVVYRYTDVADFNATEFRSVPLTSPLLPGGGPVTNCVEFHAALGPHIETYKSKGASNERAPLLVSEAIEPPANTTDQTFQSWYRDTYMLEVSQIKGWRRSSRFVNAMAGGLGPGGAKNAKPKWLTLHEFEASTAFGGTAVTNSTKVSSLLGQSAETRDMEKSLVKKDIALFRLARVYGDGTTAWGKHGDEKIL